VSSLRDWTTASWARGLCVNRTAYQGSCLNLHMRPCDCGIRQMAGAPYHCQNAAAPSSNGMKICNNSIRGSPRCYRQGTQQDRQTFNPDAQSWQCEEEKSLFLVSHGKRGRGGGGVRNGERTAPTRTLFPTVHPRYPLQPVTNSPLLLALLRRRYPAVRDAGWP